ncbi:Hypothetical predicted protein [Mytilus galloprovincialis]|uniref:Uncharacterized protein n=1 Tax=Mytilus galloprovincialis TaxID=29158 RepID=A0A8B6E2U5_MYTGA|nr:Hypothetical predicted protein [Mytilus galloprovincialis]
MSTIIITVDGHLGTGKSQVFKNGNILNFNKLNSVNVTEVLVPQDVNDWIKKGIFSNDVTDFERNAYIYESSHQKLEDVISAGGDPNKLTVIIVERGLEPAHNIFSRIDSQLKNMTYEENCKLQSLYDTLSDTVKPSDLIISLEVSKKTSIENDKLSREHRSFYPLTIWNAYRKFRPDSPYSHSFKEEISYHKNIRDGSPRIISYLNVEGKTPDEIKNCLSEEIKQFILKSKQRYDI